MEEEITTAVEEVKDYIDSCDELVDIDSDKLYTILKFHFGCGE
jgi:hypothetical protein